MQYISHHEWTWSRLRTESPKKYQSYVDLEPGVWTTIRIEVQGTRARLFVHGQPQPTLIVNDLKTGEGRRGGIALWIDVGTEAHFRNVTISPAQKPPAGSALTSKNSANVSRDRGTAATSPTRRRWSARGVAWDHQPQADVLRTAAAH